MYQKEIEFFWPLTEQIPLDLDYSDCVKPKLTVTTSISLPQGLSLSTAAPTWTTSFRLEENYTTMVVSKKPNLLRKLVFKLLGFKWEIK